MLVAFIAASVAVSCGSNPEIDRQLTKAEEIMEQHPDSSMAILSGIDWAKLGSDKERARYALLMSMALDKNYINTTTFDVLQPAIDYFLDKGKGTPDDKLRTYYYQGRIFQNKGERDNALNSFVKGIDNSLNNTDSLTLVRTLVAQAYLYYEFYDFESYTNANLRAAKICKKLSHRDYEFICLLNALNGAIVLDDKNIADSLLKQCNTFEYLNNDQNMSLLGYRLSHALKFGSAQDLMDLLTHKDELLESDINNALNVASAYNKLGDNYTAKNLLDYIDTQNIYYDTLKYQSIYVAVLKDIGDYKDALNIYENFSHRVDALNSTKFDQKAHSINEKHNLELKAQEEATEKSKILWSSIGIIVVLALGVIILLLILRSNKAKKELAFQKAKSAELENERLKTESEKLALEKSRLALENENLQLERDNKALEAENLAHRVETLENESESLKNLIANTSEEIPLEVQSAIKVRIEMLNSLLAGYITSNEQYEKPYDTWVKELTDNTEEFMNSNRLAFQVSHPRFIEYFEEHGLTVDEINYVCLYAIGLRGKEVGNYMKKRSHVNISSAIRKKLGIDKHETNIGIYVRKLLKSL